MLALSGICLMIDSTFCPLLILSMVAESNDGSDIILAFALSTYKKLSAFDVMGKRKQVTKNKSFFMVLPRRCEVHILIIGCRAGSFKAYLGMMNDNHFAVNCL